MTHAGFHLTDRQPQVVGSIGSLLDLEALDPASAATACDMVEIRMDLLAEAGGARGLAAWQHLHGLPLLFTARRPEEGGACALSAAERIQLLTPVVMQAAWIDIEVASIPEMTELIADLARQQIPWLASFHDFEQLPPPAALDQAAQRARDAGASAFKAAAQLKQPADMARLAEFQLADHGLPVATMGMGPLAVVSRLLCAQCGSVFNYGFLGTSATAPGQWDARSLKDAIARLVPIHA